MPGWVGVFLSKSALGFLPGRILQLTLEQQQFEHAVSLMCGFFLVNIQLALQVSHLWIQPTTDQKQYFPSEVRSLQIEGRPYALFHTILFVLFFYF